MSKKWPSEGIAEWNDGANWYISVTFSWNIEEARRKALAAAMFGYHVIVGGPAVMLNPGQFVDVAEIGDHYPDAIRYHNPSATFTSRGCIRRCKFCAVPKLEGTLVELDDWPLRCIICDNNLLACSVAHFDRVIDRLLESELTGVDFNQGLDSRLLTDHHVARLVELHKEKKLAWARLAWDSLDYERPFMVAYERLRKAGMPKNKISVYVLIGFTDVPKDALYRLDRLREMGVKTFPMRYQPLDARKKNEYIAPNWTDRDLKDIMRLYSNDQHFRQMPLSDYGTRPMWRERIAAWELEGESDD